MLEKAGLRVTASGAGCSDWRSKGTLPLLMRQRRVRGSVEVELGVPIGGAEAT